jgi:2-polyprenyl-6-methoxyphenol hydroxylase-like FAD-dependent oxidoreductase
MSSAPVPGCTARRGTEKVLLDAVRQEPLAEIRFNCEVVSVDPEPDQVRLCASGNEFLTFHWLVAADGAGSAVRHQLRVETTGPGDMGHFLNVMFRANYGPYLRDRRAILYPALSDEYFEHFVAINGADLWLMHHFLQPGEGVQDYTPERMQPIVAKASGLPAEPLEILSIMPWVMSPKVAALFRIGRVLLVGDAAARLSPAGGLGLNTGLQAAHNLAWKTCIRSTRSGGGFPSRYLPGRTPWHRILDHAEHQSQFGRGFRRCRKCGRK